MNSRLAPASGGGGQSQYIFEWDHSSEDKRKSTVSNQRTCKQGDTPFRKQFWLRESTRKYGQCCLKNTPQLRGQRTCTQEHTKNWGNPFGKDPLLIGHNVRKKKFRPWGSHLQQGERGQCSMERSLTWGRQQAMLNGRAPTMQRKVAIAHIERKHLEMRKNERG